MDKRKALGRGLEALIPVSAQTAENNLQQIVNIDVTAIKPNKYQPRQNFIPRFMEELKASIKEKGFIQPLLIRQSSSGYELIAGERRWRAAKELGILQVPAIIKDIENEADLLEIALIENLQREELNPIEEAQAFKRLMDEFGFHHEKVAQIVGKETVSIVNTLRLLKLPPAIQKEISQGNLSEGHGRAILSLEDPQEQALFAQQIIKNGLSVREAENRSRQFKQKKSSHQNKSQGKKNPQLVAWEEDLQKIFGTKVKILHRRQRGKVELEYYSLDDLERLVRLLIKAK